MKGDLIFRAENICKYFPGVKALDNFTFNLHEGEVFALIGENGAGKSTFINVMAGIYQPDDGKIEINGKYVAFPTPRSAFDAGIGVVHQELNYISEISVAENIMMSGHPINKFKIVDWKKMNTESELILNKIGLNIDPKMKMMNCTVAQKQQIEIAKALYWNVKILILDEPTSALNNIEIRNLLNYLEIVKNSGVAIVYISHKLEEIFEIADNVCVMRDGQHIKTLKIEDASVDELITLMVGRNISEMYPKENSIFGNVVMSVENMSNRQIKDISFNLHKGEILGVYGLMGSGHVELGKMLFGDIPSTSGVMTIDGKKVEIRNPSDAVKFGLAYVPGERKTEGLVLNQSVLENIVSVHYQKIKKYFTNSSYEKTAGNKWIKQLHIKTSTPQTHTKTLSGGNQQKVVLAKWLEINPKVLIMIDPTKGIDVGSKAEIYKLLDSLCGQGFSIIMITSEMGELLAMSDSVLVMYNGKINMRFTRDELTQVNVVSAAMGVNHD